MKDFLHGRSAAQTTSPRHSDPPASTTLRPFPQAAPESIEIAPSNEMPPNTSLEETHPQVEAPTAPAEPQVELIPDSQGRIGHIVVTCRCGDQIILQCNY